MPSLDDTLSSNDISREIRDFDRRQERRRRVVPRAALVGLLAGLVASAFRLTLEFLDRERDALFRAAHGMPQPWGLLLVLAVCGASAAVGLWLVRRFAPETSGSGIPHLKAVLHRLRGMRWRRVLLVKFASGVFGIGAGLALGREGPTVQMGGSVGQMVSRWVGGNARERHILIAAGAGAGLAAAFNAPLAGVIFVLEELRRDFAPGALTGAFIASVTADVVVRLAINQSPVFHVASPPVPPLDTLPLFLILGVVAGLLGIAFNRTLLGTLRLFERTARWPFGLPAGLVGIAVALIGWFAPETLGGGGPMVQDTLNGRLGIQILPLTGIVLILEMTSSYPLMLPLLAACFTAYALADMLHDRPIYEALLERDLLRGRPQAAEEESRQAKIVEVLVEAGSPFDGRRVADLGLPPGCLLITIQRDERDEVPSRDTVLQAGDRLTAVVAPAAVGGIETLRHGADYRG
jgi:CIC family chloride channel protein